MKKLITVILILVAGHVMATNRYISNGGSNAANGLTPATAWQTLSKINTGTVASGDSILLDATSTWHEALPVVRINLHYGRYNSTTLKPTIDGFSTITGWTPAAGGRWFATLATDSMLNMVTIDGAPQIKGRFPNADAVNGGYLSYTQAGASPVANRLIVPAGTYAINDLLVIKANDWRIETDYVTAISNAGANDTLTVATYFNLNNGSTDGPEGKKNLFGRFKQFRYLKDTALLDQYGEWGYDDATNKLYVNFGATNPNILSIQAATIETLAECNFSGCTFENISFTGGNLHGILGSSVQNILIKNCEFDNMGAQAIGFYRLYNSEISYNNISNCLQMGIYVRSSTSPYINIAITRNNITAIGNYPGMGGFNQNGDYCAISTSVYTDCDISYNSITFTGIDPIRCGGSLLYVHHNYIYWFNFIAQDKAGIYSYWPQEDPNGYYFYGRFIYNNIIGSAIGCLDGTPPNSRRKSSSMYLDGVNKNWTIYNNVCFDYSNKWLNCNIRDTVNVYNNIAIAGDSSIYGNSRGLGIQQQGSWIIRNVKVSRNYSYLYQKTQAQFYYEASVSLASLPANIAAIGKIDSNYYNQASIPSWKVSTNSANSTDRTQALWYSYTGQGQHDILLADKPKSETKLIYNWSDTSRTFPLTGSWVNISGTTFTGSITLAAYGYTFLVSTEYVPPVYEGVKVPFRLIN